MPNGSGGNPHSGVEWSGKLIGRYVNEQDYALVKGPLRLDPLFLKDPQETRKPVCIASTWRSMQAVVGQNQECLGVRPYPIAAAQPAPTTRRLTEPT